MKNTGIKYFIFFLLANVSLLICHAQEPVSSHFFIPTLSNNPSNVVLNDFKSLLFNYRNQWPGNPASYKTYNIAYTHPLPKIKSGLGFWVQNDVQANGIYNNLLVSAAYGYNVKLSNKNRLLFGLQTNIHQFSSNLNGLQLESPSENLSSRTSLYLDFSLGSKIIFDKTYVGLSIRNVTPPIFLMGDNNPFEFVPQYLFESGTTIPLKENGIYQTVIDITPCLQFSQQRGHQYINFGSYVRWNNLITGLWVRQNVRFNYDSFSFSLGILQPTYNFVYSYDMRAPWNMNFFGNSGAHEVTFFLKLQYNKKRNKLRTIKCPEI